MEDAVVAVDKRIVVGAAQDHTHIAVAVVEAAAAVVEAAAAAVVEAAAVEAAAGGSCSVTAVVAAPGTAAWVGLVAGHCSFH